MSATSCATICCVSAALPVVSGHRKCCQWITTSNRAAAAAIAPAAPANNSARPKTDTPWDRLARPRAVTAATKPAASARARTASVRSWYG